MFALHVLCLQCDVSNNAVHGHFVIFTGAPATFSRLAMIDFFFKKHSGENKIGRKWINIWGTRNCLVCLSYFQ